MKKVLQLLCIVLACSILSGFSYIEDTNQDTGTFNIINLYDYQKKFASETIDVCYSGSTKTYMDYRAITARSSIQYTFINEKMTVDEQTGFLYDEDGFIGVALGSYFGDIGSRYYFTLENGVVLPLVKCDGKSDLHTDETGCFQAYDGSVIEFVIDKDIAMSYFGRLSNNYILNGNFNNYSLFKGDIIKIEKVLDEENEKYVSFKQYNLAPNDCNDIFYYASGY